MRATLKRRLETLERRSNIAEITPVPIVDTTKWSEGDRLAFLGAEPDEADTILERCEGYRQPIGRPNEITLIVISRQPDTAQTDVEDAPPVTLSTAPVPEPELERDLLVDIRQQLVEREARRQEVEAERVIREREARRMGRWY